MSNGWWHKMMIGLATLVASIALGSWAYLQHPKFGKLPEGDRLARIERSPHFKDGEFRNQVATPMFADDRGFLSVLVGNLLTRAERLQPDAPLPSVKTDLKALDDGGDTVVWLGHSTYFVQIGGRKILIDPASVARLRRCRSRRRRSTGPRSIRPTTCRRSTTCSSPTITGTTWIMQR